MESRARYLYVVLAVVCLPANRAFLLQRRTVGCYSNLSTIAFAKKAANSGKGFAKNIGKPRTPPTSPLDAPAPPTELSQEPVREASVLQSIEGGSRELPRAPSDEVSAEDRAKTLLREKYGMKTLEEERLNAKQLEQLNAQRKRMAELKSKADAGEDIDLIALIPGPVIQAIYKVCQVGIAITGILFIGSGLGITLEAWSKTSGDPLPENVDSFIVNVVEPNFTTMLLVLLGFSISLGALAAAQLGSKSAQYTED